jgi:hypothetical protein
VKGLRLRYISTLAAESALFTSHLMPYPKVRDRLFDISGIPMSATFHGRRVICAPHERPDEGAAAWSQGQSRRERDSGRHGASSRRVGRPDVAKPQPWNLFKYLSHRSIRWYTRAAGVSALLFLGAAISSDLGVFYLPVFIIALGAAVGSALTTAILVDASSAPELLVVETLGVQHVLTAGRYQTWQPSQGR